MPPRSKKAKLAEEMDDNFDFMAVPKHLHKLVLEKYTYKEQSRFKYLNSYCNNLAEIHKNLMFPTEVSLFTPNYAWNDAGAELLMLFQTKSGILRRFDISDYPQAQLICKNINIPYALNDELCDELLAAVKKNRILSKSILFTGRILCKPNSISQLIEIVQTKKVTFEIVEHQYLELEAVQRVHILEIRHANVVNDEIFLSLRGEGIHLTRGSVTPEGIVAFVKQWQNNERNINMVELVYMRFPMLNYWEALAQDSSSKSFCLERKTGEILKITCNHSSITFIRL